MRVEAETAASAILTVDGRPTQRALLLMVVLLNVLLLTKAVWLA